MNKNKLKEVIIEYINKQEITDIEFKPGWYYFTNKQEITDIEFKPGWYYFATEIKIEDDGSVFIHAPCLTEVITKK